MMTFEKENTTISLGPLALLLTTDGMERGQALEVRVSEDAAVVLKKEMTALELVRTIRDLSEQTKGLLVHLAEICGPCKHCRGGCPCLKEETPVRIPEDLLDRAGIPRDARLDVSAMDGEIYIAAADGPDLRDVPLEMLELFQQTGICLCDLDVLLRDEDAVYDS